MQCATCCGDCVSESSLLATSLSRLSRMAAVSKNSVEVTMGFIEVTCMLSGSSSRASE